MTSKDCGLSFQRCGFGLGGYDEPTRMWQSPDIQDVQVKLRANPQFAHTTVKGILKGVLNFTFKGNIQHVSIEFLGIIQSPPPCAPPPCGTAG